MLPYFCFFFFLDRDESGGTCRVHCPSGKLMPFLLATCFVPKVMIFLLCPHSINELCCCLMFVAFGGSIILTGGSTLFPQLKERL